MGLWVAVSDLEQHGVLPRADGGYYPTPTPMTDMAGPGDSGCSWGTWGSLWLHLHAGVFQQLVYGAVPEFEGGGDLPDAPDRKSVV